MRRAITLSVSIALALLLLVGAAPRNTMPAPSGLTARLSDDPVATAEAQLAAKFGIEYLACFRSESTVAQSAAASSPVEYAFADALPGDNHASADVERMLTIVKRQWKDFQPLSKEFKDTYIARLNSLIESNGSPAATPEFVSVQPILVSITPGANYYTVTSLRTYVIDTGSGRKIFTRVNADAIAFRRSRIIRLTIQRKLLDPSDVAQVQRDIAAWAQAVTS
jgi:hypothetical protein